MKVTSTGIPEVKIIEPTVFPDDRGFFFESFNERQLRNHGIIESWVQDNQSHSRRGVIRGLHYQLRHSQGKLIRVLHGEVFDVAVDIRKESPTLGFWVGVLLSGENLRMLWIPKGFAHGFLTLSDMADVLYKATDYYDPEYERTILWNDPDVGIQWPLKGIDPLLSAKDLRGVRLSEADLI